MTSGATYSGVPQKVHVFCPDPIFLANPKSTWKRLKNSSEIVKLTFFFKAPFNFLRADSSAGKESACNVGDLGSIPGMERSPGEEKGYPLQYSGLENSMDCIVHGVAKNWTQLSNFHLHFFSLLSLRPPSPSHHTHTQTLTLSFGVRVNLTTLEKVPRTHLYTQHSSRTRGLV